MQEIVKELSSILSQNASIKPLIQKISSSPYKNWCWIAEEGDDISMVCQDAVSQQNYSDGDWDTLIGYNYIIGMCFEFSGGE